MLLNSVSNSSSISKSTERRRWVNIGLDLDNVQVGTDITDKL